MRTDILPIEEPNIPEQKRSGELIHEIESALKSGIVSREIVGKILDFLDERGIKGGKREQINSILLSSMGHAGYVESSDRKIILDLIKEAERKQL